MRFNNNKRVILVSTIGSTLEFYDFIIYLLLAPILAELFFHGSGFHSLIETYAVFAIGYFFRPVGGIILGHIGDKFGRKSTFLFTIFLMTFSTFFMASLPTTNLLWGSEPYLLLLFRICQGIAVGGEIPGSTTFVFEHLPKRKRLVGCAFSYSGCALGVVLAITVVAMFRGLLTHEEMLVWGWRPPFFIGALIGAIGIYIRYSLSDTPAFLKAADEGKLLKIPLIKVLKKYYIEVLLCFLLILGCSMLDTALLLLISNILHIKFHYSLSFSYMIGLYFAIAITVIPIIAAWLISKSKQQNLLIVISTIALAVLLIPSFYIFSLHSPYLTIIFAILLSLAYSPIIGTITYIVSLHFPPEIRFSGISFSYNLAFALGSGLTPIIITILIDKVVSIYAVPYFLIFASIICIISIIFLMIRNRHGNPCYD